MQQMVPRDQASSISDRLSRKTYQEDQNENVQVHRLMFARDDDQRNMQASSFVGQDSDNSEALQDANDFRNKASQSFVP